MIKLKLRPLIVLTAAATLVFSQSALAATPMDSIGTGSTGSYSHGETKSEGSKSKATPHHLSGSKGHHISGGTGHHKLEGSGSKKSHSLHGKKGHSYSHKKSEGSGSKSYSHHKKSHGSSHHAKSGHGYSKGFHKSHSGHSSKCPFTHLLRFKDKLGLTEAQVAEIKKLRFEYQKKSVRNKAEHKIAHMDFDKQIHSEKIDARAIRSAAGKIAATKSQMIMATAEAKISLLSLLTDEQRKKAHSMHSAHSAH